MHARAWQHDGELTQTVPWFTSNDNALRATIADLMQSPGVRSVSFQQQKSQLVVRYDRALTSEAKLRSTALNRTAHASHALGRDAVRWAPTAGKVILSLAAALAR